MELQRCHQSSCQATCRGSPPMFGWLPKENGCIQPNSRLYLIEHSACKPDQSLWRLQTSIMRSFATAWRIFLKTSLIWPSHKSTWTRIPSCMSLIPVNTGQDASLCLAQMSELGFNRSGAFMKTQLNTNVVFAEAQPLFLRLLPGRYYSLKYFPSQLFERLVMECNFRSDTFSFNSVWRGVTLLVCVATNCNDIALKIVSAMQINTG